jgi:hypothetical protein
VLLASARDRQHRPGLIESADLVRNGLAALVATAAYLLLGGGWYVGAD